MEDDFPNQYTTGGSTEKQILDNLKPRAFNICLLIVDEVCNAINDDTYNCCSSLNQCDLEQGDCDNDSDCSGDLTWSISVSPLRKNVQQEGQHGCACEGGPHRELTPQVQILFQAV